MSSQSQPWSAPSPKLDQPGQPAWRIALFYPPQGSWTETDYLELDGGPLVEFDNGCIEVLDMPTKEHQRIAQFLFVWLREFVVSNKLGEAFIAPLPVRLWPEKYREPDVLFLRRGRADYGGYPDGADLVIEVVSPDQKSRRRDIEIKPAEYSAQGLLNIGSSILTKKRSEYSSWMVMTIRRSANFAVASRLIPRHSPA